MRVQLTAFLPLLLIISAAAPAQNSAPLLLPKIEHLSIEDGLPFREMLNFVQDQQGFFWFSTKVGVFRYDGYQFVPLRTLAKNGRLLPPAFSRTRVQPDGRLLLTVQETRFFNYDPRSNEISVHPLHQLTGQKVLPVYFSHVVFEDECAFLFEMRENGKRYLLRYSESGAGSLTRLDSTTLRSPDYFSVLKDPAGNLFWGTQEAGIRRYAPDGRLADSLQVPFMNFDKQNPLWSNECFFDAKGQLNVKNIGDKKLQIWDWENRLLLPAALSDFDVNPYVVNDRSGNTWLISIGRLLLLDPQNRVYDLTPLLKEKADYVEAKALQRDNAGQVWMTCDNGIFRLGIPKTQFTHYLSAPQPKWAKTTRGLFEDKNGVVYFRCESCGGAPDSTIFRINEASGQAECVPFFSNQQTKEGLFIWSKHFLRTQNQIWTISKTGIVEMNPDERTARLHTSVNPVLMVNNTANIGWGKTRQGEIVAGSSLSQLLAFDPATEKMRLLLPGAVPDEADGFIKIILEAKDSTLWVGLANGLVQVDPRQGKILQRFGSDTHQAFLTQDIQTLFEDADGTIWAGVFGGGLVHIFPKTGEAENFTTADGLPDNIVAAILPYGEDYLWISTFNGLSCFHKKQKTFVNFYEEDGLSHNEFNISSAFIDSKGRYYFGGMNGVNAFYPAELLQPQVKPLPLLLTGFSFYDEKSDTLAEQFGGLQSLTNVTFSPHVTWFQFNYALPDFVNPKLNQFQTWLENFEKTWTYQGTTPFIRYNRLPAGNYTLHIKAADAKGYWSQDELTIKITVRQVFYKTWWFILLCCAAVGAGAFAIVRNRFQQKIALERMRTRIASDLHDEVGSSLSHLNFVIGAFDLENAPEQTAKGIEKSKEIMRKTASNIRDVVWAIDARRDKTGDLLDRMEDFAYDMFSAKNITHHFSVEGIKRDMVLNPFLRQNIYLIFKEAVNNIAKHSSATEVHISLVQKGEFLEMSVADNGQSVNGSKVKGLGLENMDLRAKRIGGTVEIEQGERGFLVRLRVKAGS